jgi:hypothetical protein
MYSPFFQRSSGAEQRDCLLIFGSDGWAILGALWSCAYFFIMFRLFEFLSNETVAGMALRRVDERNESIFSALIIIIIIIKLITIITIIMIIIILID